MEDRRVRKDLQENYIKLLDLCVAYVGRSSDQGSWLRRTTAKDGATNGKDSPLPRIGQFSALSRTSHSNQITRFKNHYRREGGHVKQY
jgi:hypothetical protein